MIMRKNISILITLLLTFAFPIATPTSSATVEADDPPSINELEATIDAGKDYIDRLYEAGGTYDYVKEYPACPLAVRIHVAPTFLVGQGAQVSKIENVEVYHNCEKFTVYFKDEIGGSYNFHVNATRQFYTGGATTYSITFLNYMGSETIDLYLNGTLLIDDVTSQTGSQTVNRALNNYQCYPAHRYTARHGFQLCELTYQTWGDHWNGEYLTDLLEDYGLHTTFMTPFSTSP
jgi:hypothetical protein